MAGGDPISNLPELIEMAEKRLGRVGSALVKIVLLVLLLVVLVWGIGFIWTNGIQPVWRASTHGAPALTNLPSLPINPVPPPSSNATTQVQQPPPRSGGSYLQPKAPPQSQPECAPGANCSREQSGGNSTGTKIIG